VVAFGPLAAPAFAPGPGGERPSARRTGPRARRPTRARDRAPVTRTIRRVVEVVPGEIWAALGALAGLALLLAAGSALATVRARRLDRQRRALLEDVGLLQAALLPNVPGRIGAAATSAAYRPAEGPGAGGDFYDAIPLGDGALAIMVGDVSGHGRAALPQTALMRHTLGAYLKAGLGPRAALQVAAGVLDAQLEPGEFVTVVVAVWDPRTRTLTYSPAGHPPPVVLGPDHEHVTACGSPPIGTGLPTGLRETRLRLPGPALVCFHTDGITDMRRGGRPVGEDGLRRTLEELGPGATADELLERLAREADRRPDDMAACVLELRGFGSVEPGREEELELRRDDLLSPRPARFLEACGIGPDETAEVLRAARQTISRVGAAVVRVRIDGRGVRADLHLSNLEVLPLASPRPQVGTRRGA
jgi:stage II sporulation SpoE-like protein